MSAAGLTPGGGIKPDLPFTPVRVAILTVSDTRDAESDTSGRVLVERGQLTSASGLDEEEVVRRGIEEARRVEARIERV